MNPKFEFYQRTIKIWNELCELHKKLHEITSEEYISLLSSDVEKVEESIKEKELVIKKITNIDEKRNLLLKDINTSFNLKITNFFELNDFFITLEFEKRNKHLNKFNQILKQLIQNIQKQNKTNQLFINKAIINLDKIKNAGTSNKNYSLYNNNGALKK